MQIEIIAVGRMKKGAEQDLVQRYSVRLAQSGMASGLQFLGIKETPESRASSANLRMEEEGKKILNLMQKDSKLVLLDERGENLSSVGFAKKISQEQGNNVRCLSFAIGGADGHAEFLHNYALWTLSLGRLTWPHQIVRILLAEQLYRCATILNNHPYHRY